MISARQVGFVVFVGALCFVIFQFYLRYDGTKGPASILSSAGSVSSIGSVTSNQSSPPLLADVSSTAGAGTKTQIPLLFAANVSDQDYNSNTTVLPRLSTHQDPIYTEDRAVAAGTQRTRFLQLSSVAATL
jgi:hypothetical protein